MNYKQLSIEDVELIELPPILNELNNLENMIYGFLRVHHLGKDNAIKADPLAKRFNLTERELRTAIANINENCENVIESSAVGYWAWDGTSSDRSNMLFNRLIGSVKRAIKNEKQLLMAYQELNQIKEQMGLWLFNNWSALKSLKR